MLTVWTATQVCEHQPTPRACLLVPKEMLGVSVTRPGTGLAAPWLSLWVSWAVSVQQGTQGGVFSKLEGDSQLAGDLTLPGRLCTGPGIAGRRQCAPDTS